MGHLHPLVSRAYAFLADDEAIPFDLVVGLMELGYDVEALERTYHLEALADFDQEFV